VSRCRPFRRRRLRTLRPPAVRMRCRNPCTRRRRRFLGWYVRLTMGPPVSRAYYSTKPAVVHRRRQVSPRRLFSPGTHAISRSWHQHQRSTSWMDNASTDGCGQPVDTPVGGPHLCHAGRLQTAVVLPRVCAIPRRRPGVHHPLSTGLSTLWTTAKPRVPAAKSPSVPWQESCRRRPKLPPRRPWLSTHVPCCWWADGGRELSKRTRTPVGVRTTTANHCACA
jgi:hypothetical protein